MKKLITILLCICTIFLVGGCNSEESKMQKYSDSGFTITLPKGFYKKELASVTVYYESEYAILTALKESYTNLEPLGINNDSSLEDYAKAVLSNNQQDSELKKSDDGNFVYFTYEKEVSDKDFYYMAAIFKAEDAFWLVNFACEEDNKDTYSKEFIKWAESIEV